MRTDAVEETARLSYTKDTYIWRRQNMIQTVGFIGIGIMGKPMARNLMKHGFALRVYARSQEKAADLVAEGAEFCPTIGQCVQGCDAVITMVGFPKDVEDVYFGKGHILDCAVRGTYLIDMTTTSPTLAKTIYEKGKDDGFHVLDAPVTGGDTGAINGTLSILVGGDEDDFKACLPLFEAMGTNINYQGAAGFGQHAKLANQIMIAGALSGVCEALAYAKAKGLNLDVLLQSVATGAAGSAQLNAFGSKIVNGDYAPGFYIKHFIKDMTLANNEALREGLHLEMLRQVLANYTDLVSDDPHNAELGTQGLIQHYKA